MTSQPGPRDEFGRPQDSVPGGPNGAPQDWTEPQHGPQYTDQYGNQYDTEDDAQRAGGFRAFPFPSYTTRTRSGGSVMVGGCCLPIPLGCLMTTVALTGVVATKAVRHWRS